MPASDRFDASGLDFDRFFHGESVDNGTVVHEVKADHFLQDPNIFYNNMNRVCVSLIGEPVKQEMEELNMPLIMRR